MKYLSSLFILLVIITACDAQKDNNSEKVAKRTVAKLADTDLTPVNLSDAEWKKRLDQKEYYILRQKGTERAFTGKYVDNKKSGTYVCAGCQLPLFDAQTKYRSGTGWPSFYEPIKDGHVAEEDDLSYGMVRTEVLCGRCGGHLGHVFPDGPRPTGLRYCINGFALDFEEEKPTGANSTN